MSADAPRRPDESAAEAGERDGAAGETDADPERATQSATETTDQREPADLGRPIRELFDRRGSLSLRGSIAAGAAVAAAHVAVNGWWYGALVFALGAILAGYGHNGTTKGNAIAGAGAVAVTLTARLAVVGAREAREIGLLSELSDTDPVYLSLVLVVLVIVYATTLLMASAYGAALGLLGGGLAGDSGAGSAGSAVDGSAGGDVVGRFDRRK